MTGSPTERPVGIGVDWGSSRLRARAFTGSGEVVATMESDAGVLVTEQATLADVLDAAIGEWCARWPGVEVIASGMVGSRDGLTEVPYVATPATSEDVRRALTAVEYRPGRTVRIVPGLCHRTTDGVDVLRGEETALVGWMHRRSGSRRSVVVLPGTHSKWAEVTDGSIRTFCTFPTGELFATLLQSASLAGLTRADNGPVSSTAYREGLSIGLSSRGLLHDYFSIRAGAVAGSRLPAVRDRLSGLLIGYEIAEAESRGLLTGVADVTVIGESPLAERYVHALGAAGIMARTPSQDCVVQGWLALAGASITGG